MFSDEPGQMELPLGWPEIDLDGVVDEAKDIKYIGRATMQPDGSWRVLANVCGALCIVEVNISYKREEDHGARGP